MLSRASPAPTGAAITLKASARRGVQPFLDAWHEQADVHFYKSGEDGPQAARDLLARDGRVWLDIE